jgi:hypothetical protein
VSLIRNQWNKENDAAVFSPGDPSKLNHLKHSLNPETYELTDLNNKKLEFSLYGTALNDV